MLASSCGLVLPNVQVWPVLTSYTAAVTVPLRADTYEVAAVSNGLDCGVPDEAGAAGVAVALGLELGPGLVGPVMAGTDAAVTGSVADGAVQACRPAIRGRPTAPAAQALAIAPAVRLTPCPPLVFWCAPGRRPRPLHCIGCTVLARNAGPQGFLATPP
jgi:hypothetical protein